MSLFEEKTTTLYPEEPTIDSPEQLRVKDSNYLAGIASASELSNPLFDPKDLEDITKNKLELIQMGQSSKLRLDATSSKAFAVQEAGKEVLSDFIADTTKTQEEIVSTVKEVDEVIKAASSDTTALEQEAIDNLSRLSEEDPVWANIISNNRDVIDSKLLEEKKAALLRNKIAVTISKADKKSEDMPIKSAIDAVGNFFLGTTSEMIHQGAIRTGKKFLEDVKKLNDPALSIQEFSDGWDNLIENLQSDSLIFGNEQVTADLLQQLVTFDEDKALWRDGLNILELGGILATPAFKGTRALMGTMSKTGNKKLVSDLVAKELKDGSFIDEKLIIDRIDVVKESRTIQPTVTEELLALSGNKLSVGDRKKLVFEKKDLEFKLRQLDNRLNDTDLANIKILTGLKRRDFNLKIDLLKSKASSEEARILIDELAIINTKLRKDDIAKEAFGEIDRIRAGHKKPTEIISFSNKRLEEEISFNKLGNKKSIIVDETGSPTILSGLTDSVTDVFRTYLPIKGPRELVDNVSSLAQQEIEKADFIFQEIYQNLGVTKPSLDPESLKLATEEAGRLFSKRYNDGSIVSIQPKHDSIRKTNSVEISVGDLKGRPFDSEEAAKNYTFSQPSLKGHTPYQADSGEWYLKKSYPINELGYLSGMADEVSMAAGPILRNLTAPSAWAPGSTQEAARVATQKVARAEAIFVKNLNAAFDRLTTKGKNRLQLVLSHGIDEEKWFGHAEFKEIYRNLNGGLNPKETDWLAYTAYQQASDTEYYMRNLSIYRENFRNGWRTVHTPTDVFTGKLYLTKDELLSSVKGKVIRASNGDKVQALSLDKIDKLYDDGFVLLERKDKVFNGTPVPYEIHLKNDVSDSDLLFQQLGYKPGGHVHYANKYFISQRRTGKWDDGTEWEGPLQTKFVLATKTEARDFSERMNSALRAVEKWEASDFADEALEAAARVAVSKTHYNTIDDFLKAVDDGEIVKGSEFRYRFDREVDSLDPTIEDYRDSSNLHSAMRSRGKMYYSSRGDRLQDANGEPATLLNPYRTQSKAIGEAIQHWAWSDFRQEEVKRWADSYAPLIDPKSISINATPEEIIRSGKYKQEALSKSSKLVDEAESARAYLKMQMRIPSLSDLYIQSRIRRLAEWVEGKPVLGDIQPVLIDKTSSDPVAALRGLTYDMHLGVFAVPQLFLQAQSSLAAISISPKHGLAAAFDLPFFRMALINDNHNVVKKIAEIRKQVTGLDEKDFIDSVNEFRRNGFHNIGNTLATLDASPHSFYNANALTKGGSALRRRGRFFAQEGDRIGRITAWGIARREAKAEGKDLTDDAVRSSILSRTDSLLLDQGSAGNFIWQRGLAGIPTQFWNYQFKMLSAMLPYVGNKSFTGAEKARLIAGQAFFHGSYGIPFGSYLSNKYFEETGQELNPTLYKQITSGFLDAMLYAASGGEVDVVTGNYTGTGSFWEGLYDDFKEQSVFALAGGVVGADLGRALDGLARYSRMYTLTEDPTPGKFLNAGWTVLRDTVSSTRLAHKTWLAYEYGKVLSKQGTVVTDNVNKPEAWLIGLMNAQPFEVVDAYAMADQRSKFYQERVRDAINDIKNLRMEWMTSEGSPAVQAEIEAALSNYSKILEESPALHRSVIQGLRKEADSDTFYNKVFKDRAQALIYGEDVNKNIINRGANR